MRVMFLDALKRGVHAVLVYSMRTKAEVHSAPTSRTTSAALLTHPGPALRLGWLEPITA